MNECGSIKHMLHSHTMDIQSIRKHPAMAYLAVLDWKIDGIGYDSMAYRVFVKLSTTKYGERSIISFPVVGNDDERAGCIIRSVAEYEAVRARKSGA
jgi:hypothetical protein